MPKVTFNTNKGSFVAELFADEAPKTVENFSKLVSDGYYDGIVFHRVIPEFVVQGGDPLTKELPLDNPRVGSGGPGYHIKCETKGNPHTHETGALSMAHAGKDTGGSQFFITFRQTPELDGRHTAFGRVIEGMEVLAKIQRRDPQGEPPLPEPDRILSAEVLRKRDHEYQPRKVE